MNIMKDRRLKLSQGIIQVVSTRWNCLFLPQLLHTRSISSKLSPINVKCCNKAFLISNRSCCAHLQSVPPVINNHSGRLHHSWAINERWGQEIANFRIQCQVACESDSRRIDQHVLLIGKTERSKRTEVACSPTASVPGKNSTVMRGQGSL